MKSIELTEEHKTKLLEMCNKLFPKKGKWFKILCGKIYYSRSGKFPGKSIHWFEFCMTHLMSKLLHLNPILNLSFNDLIQFGIIDKTKHPIDYLYKEFKKLK